MEDRVAHDVCELPIVPSGAGEADLLRGPADDSMLSPAVPASLPAGAAITSIAAIGVQDPSSCDG